MVQEEGGISENILTREYIRGGGDGPLCLMFGCANQWSSNGRQKCKGWWILRNIGKCLPSLYVAVHTVPPFSFHSYTKLTVRKGKRSCRLHTCDRTVHSSLWSIRYLLTATEMPSSGPLHSDPVIICASEWLTLDITTQRCSCTQTVIYCHIIEWSHLIVTWCFIMCDKTECRIQTDSVYASYSRYRQPW
jgi:hypothetical protein